MSKTLLIFDLDGTLLDSIEDLACAVNAALDAQGLPAISSQAMRRFVGNGSYLLCQRAVDSVAGDQAINLDQVHDDFLAYYAKHTCDKSLPYDGVSDGLNKLKDKGFTLAIATNKPVAFLPVILDKFGWHKLFDLTLGGDSLPTKKPDPAPLLHICHTLNVDSAQAIMVGDSKNDILAGQNAGITTLGLRYGYNYGKSIDDSHPDQAFDDFVTLVDYLLGL